MKLILSLFFAFNYFLAVGQLTEIGVFTGSAGEQYPLYLYGLVVQQTPDRKALVPRGGNFLRNGMVNSDKMYLSDFLKSTYTDYGGLEQPLNAPCPEGYYPRWVYDDVYNVTALLFVKNGEVIEKSYATKQDAIAHGAVENLVIDIEKPIEIIRIADVSWRRGQVGLKYGSSYDAELSQLSDGVSSFVFSGQDVNYPEFNSKVQATDVLSQISLPTHSIINFAGTDFVSAIEMRLIDEAGNEVWYLRDTKGGYHPCINQMDCNSKLRGNNHPDDANRWIKKGNYELFVNNISTDKRAVQKIEFSGNGGGIVFEENLKAGDNKVFRLNIGSDSYKINCNVFTAR